MIVTTMNDKEILTLLLSECEEVLAFSDTKDRAFRRKVIKSSVFPVYAYAEYISKSKNHWILLFESKSKKEIGDNIRYVSVCISNTIKGYYAFMVSYIQGKPHLIMYPPHFFQRYKDRYCVDKTGKELIIHFFTHNYSYVFNFAKEEVHGSTKHGVALGVMTENYNILFRTFISYEMLKGEQIEVFTNNEKIRQEIHEIQS